MEHDFPGIEPPAPQRFCGLGRRRAKVVAALRPNPSTRPVCKRSRPSGLRCGGRPRRRGARSMDTASLIAPLLADRAHHNATQVASIPGKSCLGQDGPAFAVACRPCLRHPPPIGQAWVFTKNLVRKKPEGIPLLVGLLVLSLLFLAIALWNGFPLVFYDTGGYLAEGLEGAFLPERS